MPSSTNGTAPQTKKPTSTYRATFKRGDVVVVPFPFADKLAEKRRPALVVSSNAFNSKQSMLWVVMITSAANKGWQDDIDLPLNKTGLSSPSVVRPSKIATIESNRVLRAAGRLDRATTAKVGKTIATILGSPQN